jgi:hypothetical protein
MVRASLVPPLPVRGRPGRTVLMSTAGKGLVRPRRLALACLPAPAVLAPVQAPTHQPPAAHSPSTTLLLPLRTLPALRATPTTAAAASAPRPQLLILKPPLMPLAEAAPPAAHPHPSPQPPARPGWMSMAPPRGRPQQALAHSQHLPQTASRSVTSSSIQ